MVPGRVAPFHLLFALVIEMLAISVRKTPEVGGICWGLLEEKISLYADDALVYFNGTEAFFRGLMRGVEGFGVVSGFKVDWDISYSTPCEILQTSELQISPTF